MAVKTELQTRRDLIDPALNKAGWDAQDRTRVVSEVDTETVQHIRRDCEEGMGASEEEQKIGELVVGEMS
jgi:type I site-specific restriction endonuclease